MVDAGVRNAYTVPADSFLELLDAIQVEPLLRLVAARHESAVAFMAEAEGKLRDRPALLLGSRGPGVYHFATGLHTACEDETPLIVLLADPPSMNLVGGGDDELDQLAFFRPFAKWLARATTPGEVPALLAQALTEVQRGRRGPAVLAVPADFWGVPFDAPLPAPEPPPERSGALLRSADEVAGLLADSRHPVVIAGSRARQARDELIVAADKLGLSVYNAYRRQDAFPENHARYAGHLGIGIPPRQLDALARADLVLSLGARLDEVTTQNHRYPGPSQTLVVIGPNPVPTRRRGLTVRIDCEIGPFLRELCAVAEPRARRSSAANAGTHTFMTPPDTRGNALVHPAEVVRAVRKVVPEDTIVAADSSNFAGFVHRYWCFTAPHTQLGPSARAMGYAVPAAVAAKLAAPQRTVVAMVGDASAMMTGQELETAVRYRVPIIVVVIQSGIYGEIAMHQARTHGRLSGVSLGIIDFASWARSFGAVGYTVESPEQLEPTVSRALHHQRPTVIDVRTDPDVVAPDIRLSALFPRPRPN
ncbi:thiamine pyrophosphate-binding protein [Amycolatopsis cynarae]|uniref:Thiamine pyrophosphate-binding protein n=1 Tax=Amycolatopsis cynarae TaxID=2995223 RepID=A0ABY7B2L5_9PSEU|nr:thiamine pyrophosphate-dependent enzyme [Amycolatopsis sp. HUAS 11-8]WAL65928.1 thiamine pyrophosphate-binding protein [Amycolatopsis sp. HUAS 11-8]